MAAGFAVYGLMVPNYKEALKDPIPKP